MPKRNVVHRFRAMNTDATVMIVAPSGRHSEAREAARGIEAWFETVESTLSRFRPESELVRLNRSAGTPVAVSPMLREVIASALEAARSTGGLFDPTILPSLIAAGYDRSFEQLNRADQTADTAVGVTFTWRDVTFNAGGRVVLPRGCALDLGGIAKGWTIDQSARRLHSFDNFLVDAGGDMVVRGDGVGGEGWTVGIQHPFAPANNLTVLAIRDASVATSTTSKRNWMRNGVKQHHIIDPRTGFPTTSGVTAVTVIAQSVARAEILAKTALLLGPIEGRGFLEHQPGAEGLLVLDDQRVVTTSTSFGRIVA